MDKSQLDTGFRYQPFAPLQNGRLAMWLFLSTEIMFFTALIGSYIVLRFSSGVFWPTPEQVHVDIGLGLLNTGILVASSLTLGMAVRAAASDEALRSKALLLLTMVLAGVFLSVKAYEYQAKISRGIYPAAPRSLLYDRADENYLSRAVTEMRREIVDLEKRVASSDQNESGLSGDDESRRLEELYVIQSGIVNWTEYKVGRESDRRMRQRAIETLAHQIYPLGDDPAIERYVLDESAEVGSERSRVEAQLKTTQNQLRKSQAMIKALLQKKDADEIDEDQEDELTQETREATRLTEAIAEFKKELNPLVSRLQAIEQLQRTAGINEHYRIHLPMVIPSGNPWVNTYFLLTGCHALHLIAGWLVMAWFLIPRLGVQQSGALKNLALYWHFVDLVWLVIFPIVYLT